MAISDMPGLSGPMPETVGTSRHSGLSLPSASASKASITGDVTPGARPPPVRIALRTASGAEPHDTCAITGNSEGRHVLCGALSVQIVSDWTLDA